MSRITNKTTVRRNGALQSSKSAQNGHPAPPRSTKPSTVTPAVKKRANKKRAKPEAASANSQPIDDPVRIYLMQMGEISLLTRQEEIDAAKQIESSRTRFRNSMLTSEYVLAGAVAMLRKVYKGELSGLETTWPCTNACRCAESSGRQTWGRLTARS